MCHRHTVMDGKHMAPPMPSVFQDTHNEAYTAATHVKQLVTVCHLMCTRRRGRRVYYRTHGESKGTARRRADWVRRQFRRVPKTIHTTIKF
jgi:hypothetical protein